MAANQKRERLREAAQFIKQGDHKSAQVIFRELIKANPRDAELWYLYSFAATERDHQIKSLEKALALAPHHEKAKQRLAQLRGEAPVPPKAAPTPKHATPPYVLMVGGGLASLVVVILLIGFVLSRSQQSAALLATATQSPTPIVSIATATSLSVDEFGGGTGEILFFESQEADRRENIFKMFNLHDGSFTNLALLKGVEQASWTNDGRSWFVRRPITSSVCVDPVYDNITNGTCIGFVDAQSLVPILMPIPRDSQSFALSPDGSLIAYTDKDYNQQNQIWVMRVDGTEATQVTNSPEGVETDDPEWTPDGRFITYASQSGDIHLVALNGTDDRLLVEDATQPAWSPDGTVLAYVVQEPDSSSSFHGSYIYTVNADGTNRRKLTYSEERGHSDGRPVWSPNGNLMAFIRNGVRLYVMRADGTDRRMLAQSRKNLSSISWRPLPDTAPIATYTPIPTLMPVPVQIISTAVPARDSTVGGGTGRILYSVSSTGRPFYTIDLNNMSISPVEQSPFILGWLADGRRYLVSKSINNGSCNPDSGAATGQQSRFCLGFMNADTQEVRLFSNFPIAQSAIMSPDMNQIAYVGDDENLDQQVFVINIDGTNRRQLTRYGEEEWGELRDLTWSPDGLFIAYTVDYSSADQNRIDRAYIDGSGVTMFIQTASMPAWSPDGTQLAYISSEAPYDDQHLFVANADGSNPRQLTSRDQLHYAAKWPAWSPDGKLIAYVAAEGLKQNLSVTHADGSDITVLVTLETQVEIGSKPSWQPLPSASAIVWPTVTPVLTPTTPPTQSPVIYGPNDVRMPDGLGHFVATLYSSPGEWIGDGQGTFTISGDGRLEARGWRIGMLVDAEDGLWQFEFFAPYLEVGKTFEASAWLATSDEGVPAMNIIAPGRACSSVVGEFTVEQATPDVIISFKQYCKGDMSLELSGTVIFQLEQ